MSKFPLLVLIWSLMLKANHGLSLTSDPRINLEKIVKSNIHSAFIFNVQAGQMSKDKDCIAYSGYSSLFIENLSQQTPDNICVTDKLKVGSQYLIVPFTVKLNTGLKNAFIVISEVIGEQYLLIDQYQVIVSPKIKQVLEIEFCNEDDECFIEHRFIGVPLEKLKN